MHLSLHPLQRLLNKPTKKNSIFWDLRECKHCWSSISAIKSGLAWFKIRWYFTNETHYASQSSWAKVVEEKLKKSELITGKSDEAQCMENYQPIKLKSVSVYQLHRGDCFTPVISSDTTFQHSFQVSYSCLRGIFCCVRVSFFKRKYLFPELTICRAFSWDSSWNYLHFFSISKKPGISICTKCMEHSWHFWQQAPRKLWCSKQHVGPVSSKRMCWRKRSEKYCRSPFSL